MTAPKRLPRISVRDLRTMALEDFEVVVMRLRASGAHSVSLCIGDDSLQVAWPDHEPRDRVPAQGSGIACAEADGWIDGKVGFR